MNRKKVLLFLLISVAVAATVVGVVLGVRHSEQGASEKKISSCPRKQSVIMISMDGFRSDYLERSISPNINRIAMDGIRAEYLVSQYPTKTFPNHYTIATGLYPESHGIVSNSFLSEDRTDYFAIGKKTTFNSKWWKGEPIWNTVKKYGLKSAGYFWVGSEVKVNGEQPNYWYKYNGSVPYEDRVDQILKWLEMGPSERPSLILGYFDEPDKQGHSYGPNSTQVNKAIKRVDDMIGRLLVGIQKRKLDACVNIILTSDHGMTEVSCSRAIYLDKYISLSDARIVGLGASSLLYTSNSTIASKIVQQLKGVKNLQAYLRDGGRLPKKLHYANNKRIGDVILVPDLGWSILKSNGTCRASFKASHGYDNAYADMRGVFVAKGPAFSTGLVVRPFNNTEIYNLIAEILNVKPAPNNGTYGSLSYLLKKPAKVTTFDARATSDSVPNGCKLLCHAELHRCSNLLCPNCDKSTIASEDHISLFNLSADQVARSLTWNFPWGVPEGGGPDNSCLFTQNHFVTFYKRALRVPSWVGYSLTDKMVQGKPQATDCFLKDPRLSPLEMPSCRSSKFIKGRLAPSDDFSGNKQAQEASYVLSNSVPYAKKFVHPQGLWKRTEELIRKWAILYKQLYIISGTVFDSNGDGRMDQVDQPKRWADSSSNAAAVPTHFYKIIVRCGAVAAAGGPCNGNLTSQAFVFPHVEEEAPMSQEWPMVLLKYRASILDIETLTGTTYFPFIQYSSKLKSDMPASLWPDW